MKNYPEKMDPRKIRIVKYKARLDLIDELIRAYNNAHKSTGMTKKEFADIIGMKASQLSRILSGAQNVTYETAEQVARAFNHRLETRTVDLSKMEPERSNIYTHGNSPSAYHVAARNGNPSSRPTDFKKKEVTP